MKTIVQRSLGSQRNIYRDKYKNRCTDDIEQRGLSYLRRAAIRVSSQLDRGFSARKRIWMSPLRSGIFNISLARDRSAVSRDEKDRAVQLRRILNVVVVYVIVPLLPSSESFFILLFHFFLFLFRRSVHGDAGTNDDNWNKHKLLEGSGSFRMVIPIRPERSPPTPRPLSLPHLSRSSSVSRYAANSNRGQGFRFSCRSRQWDPRF